MGFLQSFNIAAHRQKETKIIHNSMCLNLVDQSEKHKRHPIVSKAYKNKA